MNLKKIFALLCAFILLSGTFCVQAETADESQFVSAAAYSEFLKVPDTGYYTGGVVLRGYGKGADLSLSPLELGYVLTSSPYIVLGVPTHWDLTISGGDGNYTCFAILLHQSDLSMDPFNDGWQREADFQVYDEEFDYTFTKAGRYYWEFRVMDGNNEILTFQTRLYEAYTEADETEETTTIGKVNSIIAQYITDDMSAYTRARVLHDWIIYNANYDKTSNPISDASGVLLHGRGICDSYARAYLMLCTAAGIECMYISGSSWDPLENRWVPHGWNMINLDGSWYHVDCTWDDPGTGGNERHDYFCIDDATMAKDHRWNRPDDIFDEDGMLPPSAEGGEMEEPDEPGGSYDFTFSTWDELDKRFDRFVKNEGRRDIIIAKYDGDKSLAYAEYVFKSWYNSKMNQLVYVDETIKLVNSGRLDDHFYLFITWRNPSDYIRIDETSIILTVGGQSTIAPSHYAPNKDVYTWTSSNPKVATVKGRYDNKTGPYAEVTAVGTGETTITVSHKNNQDVSDSVTITVLAAYTPDFDLELDPEDKGVEVEWDAIPGVTEYQVYRRFEGVDTLLVTTDGLEVLIPHSQLPHDVEQEVYIVALRKVAGETVMSYTSKALTYGKLTLTFTSTLPSMLTIIEEGAFSGITSLTSIEIPQNVTSIGNNAFSGCTGLTTISLPASVTSIGSGAFSGCPLKYAKVEWDSYAERWMKENFPSIRLIY